MSLTYFLLRFHYITLANFFLLQVEKKIMENSYKENDIKFFFDMFDVVLVVSITVMVKCAFWPVVKTKKDE